MFLSFLSFPMSTRNETLLNQTRISNCHNEHEAIDKSGWWWSSRGRWCGRGDEVGRRGPGGGGATRSGRRRGPGGGGAPATVVWTGRRPGHRRRGRRGDGVQRGGATGRIPWRACVFHAAWLEGRGGECAARQGALTHGRANEERRFLLPESAGRGQR